jgi:osmotically-inducible protein OsmY
MPEDSAIMAQITTAINRDKHFDDVVVKVNVKNGSVVLEGKVYDKKQRTLAETLAKNTPGVKLVENKLMLTEPIFETLTELEMISSKNNPVVSDMRSVLESHPSINSQAIRIASSKRVGVFILKGYVRSVEERDDVVRMIEKISGVRYVINDLVVDEDYLDLADSRITAKMADKKKETVVTSLTEKFFVDSSNKKIMADIEAALRRHPRLDSTDIQITPETFEIGIFHLTGTIPSEDHKKMAGDTARRVRGVRYIDNDLVVKPR